MVVSKKEMVQIMKYGIVQLQIKNFRYPDTIQMSYQQALKKAYENNLGFIGMEVKYG